MLANNNNNNHEHIFPVNGTEDKTQFITTKSEKSDTRLGKN